MISLIIIISLFIVSLGQPCNEYCKVCKSTWIPTDVTALIPTYKEIKYCTECIDGYYLDDSNFLNKGCIKRCKESDIKSDCKTCDLDEKNKCIECWEEYQLSDDRKSCEPKFVICEGEKINDCIKCETKTNGNNGTKCAECRINYIIENGYCEYDHNHTRYKNGKGKYLNNRILLISNILIIILLF